MFRGSIPALVTPFTADGTIDWPALEAFVKWQVRCESTALVPCGTTGEAATLTIGEHNSVVSTCISAAQEVAAELGRPPVPVIAGCGSNDTDCALGHMRHALAAGASAALVVVPYYNKPNQEGLIEHFSYLAENCGLPIIIYNIPGRSVVDMSVETMSRLAEIETIVGVKDATGNLARVAAQRARCDPPRRALHEAFEASHPDQPNPYWPEFCQLSGNDELALGFGAMGGHGCISVTANVAPLQCARFQGDLRSSPMVKDRTIAWQDRLWLLHDAMFADPSPGPAKYALKKLGILPSDRTRRPITAPGPAARARVDAALAHAGLA